MKKLFTTTAVILGSLYGVAEAAPITSPIYMPGNGEILTNVDVGYYYNKSTKNSESAIGRGWQANLYGKVGVNEFIAINYDFDYHFMRKNSDIDSDNLARSAVEKESARFDNFSFGVTGRVLDKGENKLDVIANFGEATNILGNERFVVADLAVRYGLDLNHYNLGLSGGIRYYNENRSGDEKTEHDLDYKVALENEFILGDQFTVGLDLFYNYVGKQKKSEPLKAYSELGAVVDANFAINKTNYVGAYFGYSMNDLKNIESENMSYGLKYTTQF